MSHIDDTYLWLRLIERLFNISKMLTFRAKNSAMGLFLTWINSWSLIAPGQSNFSVLYMLNKHLYLQFYLVFPIAWGFDGNVRCWYTMMFNLRWLENCIDGTGDVEINSFDFQPSKVIHLHVQFLPFLLNVDHSMRRSPVRIQDDIADEGFCPLRPLNCLL